MGGGGGEVQGGGPDRVAGPGWAGGAAPAAVCGGLHVGAMEGEVCATQQMIVSYHR